MHVCLSPSSLHKPKKAKQYCYSGNKEPEKTGHIAANLRSCCRRSKDDEEDLYRCIDIDDIEDDSQGGQWNNI